MLKQTSDADKIIKFFMNSYWSKTGIFVLLMRSLNEMEEVKKFQSSTFDKIARRRVVEDQDTFLELAGKIRELQMKLIAWMIRKIFKMLNQYAVDIHTLPVNLSLDHLIQFLVEC